MESDYQLKDMSGGQIYILTLASDLRQVNQLDNVLDFDEGLKGHFNTAVDSLTQLFKYEINWERLP